MRTFLCAGFGVAFLAGAFGASGETVADSPPDAAASVVVYRLGGANLAALPAVVAVNGTDVARLRRNSYAEIELPQGSHLLSVRAPGYAPRAEIEVDTARSSRIVLQLMPNSRRPGLFAAAIPVAGEAAAVAEAAVTHPFLIEARSDGEFRQSLPRLKAADRGN